MQQFSRSPWLALAVVGGLAYPFLVYFGMSRLPPGIIVQAGLALIGLRLAGTRRLTASATKVGAMTLFAAAVVLAGLLLLTPDRAVLAYPIVISLSTATVFGLSLIWPPTVIERIARLREPDLPQAGIAYTRKVTVVWTVYLLANALVSAATALWGTVGQWTLWNGLVSYVLMGLLFVGEMGVRRTVQRRDAMS